ncbi:MULTISPECIES: hypothetical protein [unclassified Kaistella]|uniref:hypothetical protein n=1 Tax=unclassified Kaistella TaxID=2762626 RepID=UPI00273296FB|nr:MULTISPECIES: hypothetical protein [unclassified Kaistella]MDP2452521.1 hypothetical protein [Kaistella sp. SH11-4b]MDP2455429.1 hypothetical protein [Kaistella sp. SH40-3]MDP2458333.1 hypothetical protein [Kaistella sp. SH19-2b]
MTDQYQVYLDPSSNIIYSSYYIKGLYEVFGKNNVTFSSHYFQELDKKNEAWSYDSYMALVIKNRETLCKIIIDFGDDSPIRENAYRWCDLYAKVNINPEKLPEQFKTKILSISPGFGIKMWTSIEALYHSFFNLLKLRFSPQVSLKNYFRSYLSQIKQLRIEDFTRPTTAELPNRDYVFFVSSLWPHPNCITGTNRYRKMYIESCRKQAIDFEGGFWVNDRNHPQFSEFKDLTISKRYLLSDYIAKTKKSLFVFNTPAVHNCHGWKLGQFLAMGKAIISTPFQNALPEDLVHSKNIHFVSDRNEMDVAVEKLLHDENYRKKLEEGAKDYCLKHVTPSAVILKICNKLNIDLR